MANFVNNDDLEIVLYSDNCCGQQKNRFFISMYMHIVTHFKIKSITHKFLITGHTQSEGDNVHWIIEKAVKRHLKSEAIYVPAQYVTIIHREREREREKKTTV
jgi:type IV secretory pathway VirB4 component